jgi:multimeric flavodoxin WrbA
MKRILGITGSPRRNGNTHILVNKILEGAKENGAITELIFLKDMDIKECDGCHTCWKGKECSKKDDMNNLYPKIIKSDIIIFGTPVYWYGPTALMKAFIDRFVYFNCPENRKKIINKSAVVAIPFEDNDPDTAAPLIELFTKSFEYLQMRFINKIIVPGVTVRGEISNIKEYMEDAYNMGVALTRNNITII